MMTRCRRAIGREVRPLPYHVALPEQHVDGSPVFDTGQLDQKTAWAGLFNLRVGRDWSPGPNGDFLISEGSP
jgi:hypothetical protein